MLKSHFNKVADQKACNFVKKKLRHRCFPVKFAKFFRTPFFTEHLCVAASEYTVFHSFTLALEQNRINYNETLHAQSTRIFCTCMI